MCDEQQRRVDFVVPRRAPFDGWIDQVIAARVAPQPEPVAQRLDGHRGNETPRGSCATSSLDTVLVHCADIADPPLQRGVASLPREVRSTSRRSRRSTPYTGRFSSLLDGISSLLVPRGLNRCRSSLWDSGNDRRYSLVEGFAAHSIWIRPY
jgi:hypothetical protein